MSDIAFNSYKNSAMIMPIRAVCFECDVSTGNGIGKEYLTFYFLESECTYSIEPITSSSSYGGNDTVGYTVNATIILANNDYSILSPYLDSLAKRIVPKSIARTPEETRPIAHLILGNGSLQAFTHDSPETINYSGSMVIHIRDCSVNNSIKGVEFRPRNELPLFGIAKFLDNNLLG